MKLDMSCDLPCELSQSSRAVKTIGLLNYVAAPIMKFECVERIGLQEVLEARPYVMKMKLFGMLPIGLHTMDFSYEDAQGVFTMRDNGHSNLCTKWDHTMTFKAQTKGVCYRDCAEIKAGILTPLVWLFALYFYKHRQCRWQRLVKRNFEALGTESGTC